MYVGKSGVGVVIFKGDHLLWPRASGSLPDMKFLDPTDPFFRPRWRRWATVIVPAAWAVFEFVNGNTAWAIVFGLLAGYAAWALFLTAPKE